MSRPTNAQIWEWLGGTQPIVPIWQQALEQRARVGLARLSATERRDIARAGGLASAARRRAIKEAKVA